MIIVVYPGVVYSEDLKVNQIYLNPSDFHFENDIYEGLQYDSYCNVAKSLSKRGYTVFVVPNETVINKLQNSDEGVFGIVPSIELKDAWLERLKNRYKESQKLTSYVNNKLKNSYEDDIKYIISLMDSVVIIDNLDDYHVEPWIKKVEIGKELNDVADLLIENDLNNEE